MNVFPGFEIIVSKKIISKNLKPIRMIVQTKGRKGYLCKTKYFLSNGFLSTKQPGRMIGNPLRDFFHFIFKK